MASPTPSLALYKYDACGYCQRVMRAIEALGIEDQVELRDTMVDPQWRKELIQATGAGTVPVLRIEEPVLVDGGGEGGAEGEPPKVRWMPESRDIIAYLYERFGEGKQPPVVDATGLHRVATMAMWALLGAGIFFTELQPELWFAACFIGAARSLHNWWRTKVWFHAAVGAVFLFACTSIVMRARGVVDLPWWYVAYGLIGVLLVAGLIARRRLRG